VTHHKQQ